MAEPQERFASGSLGPDGTEMTLKDLPASDTKRWSMRKKAQIVAGIRAGLITTETACERYSLSVEELASWQRLIDKYGVRALRATKIQDYRSTYRKDD